MGYKLIALDMDGTLLRDDKTLSGDTKYWIRRATEAGVTVTVATGRDRPSVMPFLEELGLSVPHVGVNGCEVWNADGTIQDRKLLDRGLVRQLHRLAVQYDVYYWASAVTKCYGRTNWVADIDDEDWMMFVFTSEDEQVRKELRRELALLDPMELTYSHVHNIEVTPYGVSKGSGLKRLCEAHGCDIQEVIAIGDSINDLVMIREAGLGVAMGNGDPLLKEAAKAVAPTNEEDGVAAVIRKYIFQDE